ncbi:DUF930 domain-containing protein [Hoeflea sp. G2-23]|uniref:DUF930 domain-containing protein n=1 Tax=Hoeflea algicola TaxID=2983763 RepID=A0ABT3Z834_9HYPH|nr:DUF930 domain-containing protein [Hoeflea algicola]MCY0147939.1 DUF930 domain-containing protein [Hoeflea algicola]
MRILHRIWSDGLSRALLVSLALHGVVFAALLMRLPVPVAEPEPDEQVVEVTLVAPPEPEPNPKPEPAQEAEPEPETPEPATEEPPAPEAPEQAESPPKPELEQAAAPPPSGEPAAGEAVPIPVFRPVFQFGERDAGPRVALDGNSSTEPAEAEPSDIESETEPATQPPVPESTEPDPAPTDAAAVTPDVSEQTPPEPEEAQPEPEPQEPEIAGLSLPEITLPASGLPQDTLSEPEPGTLPPATAPVDPAEPDASEADASQPPADNTAGSPADTDTDTTAPGELTEVERLFSPVLTEDRAAMVAMGSLPREIRASQLCTSELREQLRNATPAYQPELLPAYRLDSGNVLAVPDAAFRAGGAWYALSFRCTVDDDAFKVASFALSIGTAIPRAEWKARGFPDF